ncbi:hypothetical protein [Nocardia carnea]|uniref:hypothetical protein n=1 Tax=Nocardia carnea TaxID=37328 RepID=UPI002454C104|nr:hypothetical protein [Nocardia carnea]
MPGVFDDDLPEHQSRDPEGMQQTFQWDTALGLEPPGAMRGFARVWQFGERVQPRRTAVGHQREQLVMTECDGVVVGVVLLDPGGHPFGDHGRIGPERAQQARGLELCVLAHYRST